VIAKWHGSPAASRHRYRNRQRQTPNIAIYKPPLKTNNRLYIGLAGLATRALALAVPAVVHAQLAPSQPEAATGRMDKTLVTAKRYAMATAHPMATQAGLAVLDKGGSAMDAAIAAQLVLNLVEPQSSGIGGGGFLLYYDAKRRTVTALDGRETAPASSHERMLLDASGKPLPFYTAIMQGKAVGVPGVVRLMEVAHARWGRLPWAANFRTAITLAEDGYPLSPRPAQLALRDKYLLEDEGAKALFFGSDGKPLPAGSILKNAPLAQLFKDIAKQGGDAFYTGANAEKLVAAVNRRNPGQITLKDLEDYRVRTLEPVCGPYREYRVCSMPPASSGGVAVLQILATLERSPFKGLKPQSPEAIHWFSEASRLAYADRAKYLADDRFAEVPTAGLLAREYLDARAQLVNGQRTIGKAEPGMPVRAPKVAHASHEEVAGTSHIVVTDAEGNAASFTTSIEDVWGSRLVANGFLLNNQMTDFSFLPIENGQPVNNRIAPGKRPRSSMSPTLVFDADGSIRMVVGSPGGSHIINYVAKTIVAHLDWGMDIQAAIAAPNFGSRNNGPTEIENVGDVKPLTDALKAKGHDVRAIDMTSGVHAIVRANVDGVKVWQAGADPRREGYSAGR
jgi:gamma-glutamyltranspeptidase / glutathione hydrolase